MILPGDGVFVGVLVGIAVGVQVDVAVGLRVGVLVGVSVGIAIGFGVRVAVGFRVGVNVGLCVGVDAGFRVGVNVGFCVGVPAGGSVVKIRVDVRARTRAAAVNVAATDWALATSVATSPEADQVGVGWGSELSSAGSTTKVNNTISATAPTTQTHGGTLLDRAGRDIVPGAA